MSEPSDGTGPSTHSQPPPGGPFSAAGIRNLGPMAVAIGLIGAVAAVAVAVAYRESPLSAGLFVVVVVVSTWLSIIDVREHRLPNRIVGPLAFGVLVSVVGAGLLHEDLGRAGRAIGFGLAMVAVLMVANLLGGLGMGDVKYGFPMAATVGWFGWDALSVAVLVTTVTAAAFAVVVLLQGKGRTYELAYGPYMALGLVAGLLAAAPG